MVIKVMIEVNLASDVSMFPFTNWYAHQKSSIDILLSIWNTYSPVTPNTPCIIKSFQSITNDPN